MTHWRRLLVGAVGALSLVGVSTASVGADEGGTVIHFTSMTPITTSLGMANDRGLTSGSLAWRIDSGSGTVDRDGHVMASVTGLVLVKNGLNPIGTFAAVVSCRTTAQQIVNKQTPGVVATSTGDATIDATVALPHPCTTPEVFVGGLLPAATGGTVFRWFAVSNGDFADMN